MLLRILLRYKIQHSIICFRWQATYNLATAPNVPIRFSISWVPPSFARLGLITLPQIEHNACWHYFYLPVALHQMILGR